VARRASYLIPPGFYLPLSGPYLAPACYHTFCPTHLKQALPYTARQEYTASNP